MASMLYLSGTYDLVLDDKSRLAMPSRFRKILNEECGGECVLTVSLFERCLWLYPKSSWMELLDGLSTLPAFKSRKIRALNRLLLGSSVSFKFDGQGRFLVPKNLRDYAKLDKQAILVGLQNKFELWDQNAYASQFDADLSELSGWGKIAEEIPSLDDLCI